MGDKQARYSIATQSTLLTRPLAAASHEQAVVESALAQVRGWLQEAFMPVDNHHGFAHAQAVESVILLACERAGIPFSMGERLALRAAALLHDVGYSMRNAQWSRDRREHVAASLDFAAQRLPHIPIFAEDQRLLLVTYYLIAHHDDTNYRFPSQVWDGYVRGTDLGSHRETLENFERHLSESDQSRLRILTALVREADALTGTGEVGAKRTFSYSLDRGLPVAADGNPLAAWDWEESALGNVRIAAKRALLDTLTEEGKQQAIENYERMEDFLQAVCAEHAIPYAPEILRPREVNQETSSQSVRVHIVRYRGWPALEDALRKVPLRGDAALRPYAASSLTLRRQRIQDLRPTAYYALEPRIEQLRTLYHSMVKQYALSLFDLSGILDFTADDADLRMSPPVVERYFEPEEKREVAAIVDGQHRILLARELGFDEIWTVEVAQTSQTFPLVSLPLQWSEVRLVDAVPETQAKRRFRFTSLEQLPAKQLRGHKRITPDSALYYFYRDLAALGSSGIRSAHPS